MEALDRPLDRLFPAHLTLTAPTGTGKTLAALRFALALRERIFRERGFRPKVVYALPYIAIADQVEEDVHRILRKAGLEPKDHLLVHHHLALASTPGGGKAGRIPERGYLWKRPSSCGKPGTGTSSSPLFSRWCTSS